MLTYVGAYDEKQIAAAIRRELLREGQVFYVHNRVESIERAAARLRELVPEARIAVAHGQMGEHQLEQVVVDFWEKRFDVLVCTTIVETGLDISNANTLIVERADLFGLSQLHQLRGRVGRGRERAYAYFLYPPEKPLTETAHDRLADDRAATPTSAPAWQVAMKDLEIRGAGNLLGGEQSGHIAGRRLRPLRAAGRRGRRRLPRRRRRRAPAEVKIELPVDAHLPHDYVPRERLRLEAYKKLAAVADEAELAEVEAELRRPLRRAARAGAQPARGRPAAHRGARRRARARSALQGNHVRFGPVELRESQQLRLQRLYPGTIVKPALRHDPRAAPTTARVGGRPLRDAAVLDWARQLIHAVMLEDLTRTGAPVRVAVRR